MARIRNIKPEFFDDEDLARTSRGARLLFVGLWVLADREGRFGWRPAWIKMHVFPYDQDLAVEPLLEELVAGEFIVRYAVNGRIYGHVPTWRRHQIPGRDEPPSEIPEPTGELTEYDRPPNQTVRVRLYARDGYQCLYCGRDMTHDVRARCLDHVVPYIQGGTNREQNLVTCCKPCNAKKSGRIPEAAGMKRPSGFGESYHVNTPLTPRQQVSDKDREWGIGMGNREVQIPASSADAAGEGKTKVRTPKPTTEKQPTNALLSAHERFFVARYGEKPGPYTGKHGKLAASVLKTHGLERSTALLALFFSSEDPFFEQAGHAFPAFAACIPKIIACAAQGAALFPNDPPTEERLYDCRQCGEFHQGADSSVCSKDRGPVYKCQVCAKPHQGHDPTLCMKARAA
jgi:5-methylcytosine-specific restriction endonuclease McrA